MKTLKLIGMAFIAMVLSISFYSCSDDDDDGGGSPKSDVGTITTDDGNKLLLSSIKQGSRSLCSFSYDSDGKLIAMDDSDVKSNPFEVIYEDEGTNWTEKISYSFSFNGNGYASKILVEEDFEDTKYNETESYTGTCNLSYDSSGHLTKLDCKYNWQSNDDGDKDSGTNTVTANLTWKNDNLTSAKVHWEEYDYTEDTEYTYTYGNTENKYRQYIMATTFAEVDLDEFFEFGFLGYLGKGPAYLPSKLDLYEKDVDKEDGETDEDSWSITYSYTLNNDGTINTEKENNSTYTYSYITLGSTRSVLETPIAETLSSQENSKFKGIFRSIHERHKKHN